MHEHLETSNPRLPTLPDLKKALYSLGFSFLNPGGKLDLDQPKSIFLDKTTELSLAKPLSPAVSHNLSICGRVPPTNYIREQMDVSEIHVCI